MHANQRTTPNSVIQHKCNIHRTRIVNKIPKVRVSERERKQIRLHLLSSRQRPNGDNVSGKHIIIAIIVVNTIVA